MTTNAVPTHAHTFNRPEFSITGFIKPVVEYARGMDQYLR